MDIKLKRIRHYIKPSGDSAFEADLYINGKKAASAYNQCMGDPTDYYVTTNDGWELIRQAREYFAGFQPGQLPELGNKFFPEMDLEFYIDKLVQLDLEEKEFQETQKRMEREDEMLKVKRGGSDDIPEAETVLETTDNKRAFLLKKKVSSGINKNQKQDLQKSTSKTKNRRIGR